jgi:DNA-binding response OmpR family regulator
LPPRILIVEDDGPTLAGLTRLLQQAGYEIVARSTFNEGRQELRESAPDLLIADVRLGSFNGLQLIAMEPHRIPAIIVTAYDDPVLESEATRLGAAFLVKPVTPSLLLSMVDQKLAPRAAKPFAPARQWVRKQVIGDLPARVADSSARVLDVSYGGLRLEIERQTQEVLPASFTVTLPASGLSVPVDLVWSTPIGDQAWLCGAAVSQQSSAAQAWCGLVDATA